MQGKCKFKQLFLVFLSVFLISCVHDEPFTEGLAFSQIEGQDEYEVTDYTGTESNVIIPGIYHDLPVTSIAANAFASGGHVTSIQLPNSITAIDDAGLLGTSLTELWIPDGMQYFGHIMGLTDVDVRVRDTHLYHQETRVAAVRTIVNKDETELIFVNRISVEIPLYEVPETITKIGNYAMSHTNFGEIVLPNSVTEIGDSAFYYSFAKINVPNSITKIGDSAYVRCQIDENLVLPEGLTAIGNRAFGENNLVSIIFPASLIELGSGVFYSNPESEISNQVTAITFKGWQLDGPSVLAFETGFLWLNYKDTAIKEITVNLPEDQEQALLLKESLLVSSQQSDFLTDVGDDFVIIKVDFFTEGLVFSKIKDKDEYEVIDYLGTASDVVVPETYQGLPVTKISDSSFYDCLHVTSVRLPNSVTVIEKNSLIRTSLTELWIPDGMYYFGKMWDLNDIDVRVRDTHLYHREMMVGSIRTIVNKDGTELIYVNRSSVEIPVFEVPQGITKIGNYALYRSHFGEIILPDTITVVGEGAFEFSRAKVNIPTSTIEIQNWAYVRCQFDENLVLHEGLTTIGHGVFGENNLVSIVFPASLREMGCGVFYSSILADGEYNYVTTVEFKGWQLSEQSVSVFEFAFLWMNYKDTQIKEITVILPDDQAQALLLKESLLASWDYPNFLRYVGSDFVINYQEGAWK